MFCHLDQQRHFTLQQMGGMSSLQSTLTPQMSSFIHLLLITGLAMQNVDVHAQAAEAKLIRLLQLHGCMSNSTKNTTPQTTPPHTPPHTPHVHSNLQKTARSLHRDKSSDCVMLCNILNDILYIIMLYSVQTKFAHLQ